MPAKPTPRRKASGRNVEEWERGTERVTLRLDPKAMGQLRDAAAEHGWTISETVTEALAALHRELDAELTECEKEEVAAMLEEIERGKDANGNQRA